MVLDSAGRYLYSQFFRLRGMITPTLDRAANKPASVSLPHDPEKRDAILLIAAFADVYVIWGSTYLAIAVGIESFPPLLLAACRHFTAGLVLYPLLRWKTGIRPTPTQWRTAAITGLLLLLVGNGGVCLSERTLPTGVRSQSLAGLRRQRR